MEMKDLWVALDELDDGQDDCEPVCRPIPRLTAGDLRALKELVQAADMASS